MSDQDTLDQELTGSPNAKEMKATVVLVGWMVVLVGYTFKFPHWPGSGILCILGVLVVLISSTIQLIQAFRQPDSSFRFGAILRFAMAPWMLYILFRTQYWPGALPLLGFAAILTVVSGALLLKAKRKKSRWLVPAVLLILLGVNLVRTPTHKVFWTMNIAADYESLDSSPFVWHKYSWFLSLDNQWDQALEANTKAQKALEKQIELSGEEYYDGTNYPQEAHTFLKESQYLIAQRNWPVYEEGPLWQY